MLKVSGLNFSFSDKNILKNLNLVVEKSQIISIIGPSGSGKTTLFQLIAGLLKTSDCSIEIMGEYDSKKRKNYISYMMQEDLLLPWKTLLNNLMEVFEFEKKKLPLFSFKERKQLKLRIKNKALDLLKEVGLIKYASYYPHELSGGMKQRASLARSLLFNRPFMLLDEPFGAIDFLRREKLYKLIKKLHDKYKFTLLFITHDINDALALSDKIYVLEKGQVIPYEKNQTFINQKLEKFALKDQKEEVRF